jgi:hypothetical protein
MHTQQQEEVERRPRRVWWIVGLSVLALALIGIGIWAIIAANQTDDIDVATDLADEWNAAWNANDPEAVAAVFTEDGTFSGVSGETAIGRDRLTGHVVTFSPDVNNGERIGDVTAAEAGTFTFRLQFTIDDEPFDCRTEIELEGHLASRIAIVECLDTE